MAGMFSKVKAPWGSSAPRVDDDPNANKQEEGDSLTTVLPTEEDRCNLTLLVADCTELMRQNILNTFDANQTGQQYDTVTNMEPVSGEQIMLNPDIDPGLVDVPAVDKAKKIGRAHV